MSRPEYTYHPKGRNWVVYRWKYSPAGNQGTKVGTFLNREDARRECYRLNGWEYKETEEEHETAGHQK